MAASQAAYAVEKAVRKDDSPAILKQDVSNYEQHGDSTQKMKALAWMGKNKVEVSMYAPACPGD
jgi:hypothetical protein